MDTLIFFLSFLLSWEGSFLFLLFLIHKENFIKNAYIMYMTIIIILLTLLYDAHLGKLNFIFKINVG